MVRSADKSSGSLGGAFGSVAVSDVYDTSSEGSEHMDVTVSSVPEVDEAPAEAENLDYNESIFLQKVAASFSWDLRVKSLGLVIPEKRNSKKQKKRGGL